MPRLRSSLLPLLALPLLVPAAAGAAGPGSPPEARFTATFQVDQKTTWDQPRGVSLIDCRGQHYYSASGSDTWELKGGEQPVVVTKSVKGMALWTFPGGSASQPKLGIVASGRHSRDFFSAGGNTGGWCGSADQDPPPVTDCGTRLPRVHIRFSVLNNTALWSQSYTPDMRNENLDFGKCDVILPKDVTEGEIAKVPAPLPVSVLFGKQRKIEVKGKKTFGPTTYPVPNLGVDRTSTTTVNWKLTLVRKKR